EAAGLRAEESRGTDQELELRRIGLGQAGTIGKSAEQLRRNLVDPGVGALRREDGRHQELIRIRMSQGTRGLRIGTPQRVSDPAGMALGIAAGTTGRRHALSLYSIQDLDPERCLPSSRDWPRGVGLPINRTKLQ